MPIPAAACTLESPDPVPLRTVLRSKWTTLQISHCIHSNVLIVLHYIHRRRNIWIFQTLWLRVSKFLFFRRVTYYKSFYNENPSGKENLVSSKLRLTSELYLVLMFCWPCISVYFTLLINQPIPVHGKATYRSNETRGCIIQFWPPDDEHMVLETCRGMK